VREVDGVGLGLLVFVWGLGERVVFGCLVPGEGVDCECDSDLNPGVATI